MIYGKRKRNARKACKIYSQRFPGRRPDHATIKLLVVNFRRYGSFTKPKRNRSKPVRNDDNINEVVATFNENSHTSVLGQIFLQLRSEEYPKTKVIMLIK